MKEPPSTFARFTDSTPSNRPVTCSFVLDAGAEIATCGIRLVSQPDRWVTTAPAAVRVTACQDRAGIRPLVKLSRPAFIAMGSARSAIMAKFGGGHHGAKPSDAERRVFACWIDLGVPFGGSYCEATDWTDDERRIYDYHQRKRAAFAESERLSARAAEN